MPIHERGYRHWTGKRRGRLHRSLAIARCGVALALKKRSLIIITLLGIAPAFILAILIFQSGEPGEWLDFARKATGSDWKPLVGASPTVPMILKVVFSRFMVWQLVPLALIITFVGPELISQDLRVRALQIYYSRPLTRLDYVFGKLMVVATFIALVTLVPSLLLYVVALVLSTDVSVFVSTLPTLAAIVASYLVICLVAGLVILAISSVSRRTAFVGALWAGAAVASETAFHLVQETLGFPWAHLLSLRANIAQVNSWIFQVQPEYKFDRFASFVVLAIVCIVAFAFLMKRVQALEAEH